MKRGVVPVLILAFLALGGAAAQHAGTRQTPAMPPIAIMRPMAHPMRIHARLLRPALLRPIGIRRGGLLAPALRQANPSQLPPPDSRFIQPLGGPPARSAPAATPTPNPLHFRHMALPQIIALAQSTASI